MASKDKYNANSAVPPTKGEEKPLPQGEKAQETAEEKVVELEKKSDKKTKKQRKKIYGVYNVAIVVIGALGLIFILFALGKIFDIAGDNATFSRQYSLSARTDFTVVGRNVMFCTKDGVTLLSKNGEVSWTDTFSFTAPVIINDGSYTAVADDKGRQLNVYNTNGRLYSVTTEGSILYFAVNPMGYSLVIYQGNNGSDYVVDVFSSAGEIMSKGNFAYEDGIPVCADISNDGKFYAVGFININDLTLKSAVSFYYTNKSSESSNSDGMFSALSLDDVFIGQLVFMPDSSCTILTDKFMSNIGGGNSKTYVQNWKMEFTNKVTAAGIVDRQYIALAYGDTFAVNNSENASLKNTLHWYNYRSGKETGSVSLPETADTLYVGAGATIASCGNMYCAYDVRGKSLWKYSPLQTIKKMAFYLQSNKVLIATATSLDLYRLQTDGTLYSSTYGKNNNSAQEEVIEGESVAEQVSETERPSETAAEETVAEQESAGEE